MYKNQQQQISGLKSDLIKAQNSLATLKDPNGLLRKENLAKTKEAIRNFLAAINPEILQRIDAGEIFIPVRIDVWAQIRLKTLSESYPDFEKYLGFTDKIPDGPIKLPNETAKERKDFFERLKRIKQLNKEDYTLSDYYLVSMPTLIK
jgi:hypothetical protein